MKVQFVPKASEIRGWWSASAVLLIASAATAKPQDMGASAALLAKERHRTQRNTGRLIRSEHLYVPCYLASRELPPLHHFGHPAMRNFEGMEDMDRRLALGSRALFSDSEW